MARATDLMGLLQNGFFLLVILLLCIGRGETIGYGKPPNCESLECPLYDVVHSQMDFEIRSYKDATWMSTPPVNSTSYREAVETGFEMLFAYIQGKNRQGLKIDMTAPVLVDILPSTGPFCNSSFTVHFYVPQKYQKHPPLSDEVRPETWPKRRYAAVRRFGGFMNDSVIPVEASALKESLAGTPWKSAAAAASSASGPSTYSVAGYNSPFEYENRVNEVLFLFDRI